MGYIYRQTFIMKPTIVPIEILMFNNYFIYIYMYIYIYNLKVKICFIFQSNLDFAHLKRTLPLGLPVFKPTEDII